MSHTHTGAATSIGPSGAVTVTSPDDTDALTAASNNLAPEKLADYVKELFNKALFKGDAVTATIRQKLLAGIEVGAASGPIAILGSTPDTDGFAAILEQAVLASPALKFRIYVGVASRLGSLIATINARWNQSTTKWVRDDNATSVMINLAVGGEGTAVPLLAMYSLADPSNASPWNDSDWNAGQGLGFGLANNVNGQVLCSNGTIITGRAVIPPQSWVNATLNAGWVAGSGNVLRYRKDALGRVELDGEPEVATLSKTDGSVLCTLPSGFRPDRSFFSAPWVYESSGGPTMEYWWEITAGGDVTFRTTTYGVPLPVGFAPKVNAYFSQA